MTKKKKSRDTRPLNSLDKAFAIANNFTSLEPHSFQECTKEVKEECKSFFRKLGITTPNETIPESDAKRALFRKLYPKEAFEYYVSFIRTILLGHWYMNKAVYRVYPETIEFLEEFKIEYLHALMPEMMQRICNAPIFIEIYGSKFLRGFFCGITQLDNENFCVTPADINTSKLFISIVYKDNAAICISKVPNMFVEEYMKIEGNRVENSEDDKNAVLALKLLLYISFLSCMRDSHESVLVHMPGKSFPYFEVKPIPYKDSLPDFSKSGGLFTAGLCHTFGYLNRDNMVKAFEQILNNDQYTPDTPILIIDDSIGSGVQNAILYSVLQWEKHKTVYLCDRETEFKLYEKYSEQVMLDWIPSSLACHMPYQSFIIAQERGYSFLVSTCMVKIGRKKARPAILTISLNLPKPSVQIIPINYYGLFSSSVTEKIQDEISVMFCSLYHILNVYKIKAERAANKALPEEHRSHHEHTKNAGPKPNINESEHLRTGYNISDTSINLFDITTRTVKRPAKKEMERRTGYRMTPHVRRRHLHRYWVGSGENKHLEVRWLDNMRINAKDKDIKTTVIHNLK